MYEDIFLGIKSRFHKILNDNHIECDKGMDFKVYYVNVLCYMLYVMLHSQLLDTD